MFYNKTMRLLIVLFALVAFFALQTNATTVVRSVAMYATTNATLGTSVGSVTLSNAFCTTHKPSICTSTAAKSLLARSDLNLSAVSINGTVPVIWYSNNLTMASTYAGLWTLASGTSWYIQTAVTNVLGSVGQNQTYWTGADANGNYINAASSCGGNWTVNTTGNVGLTGTNDGRWMNYSTPPICGVVARPYLCVCESFATPLSVPNNIGSDTPVVIGCVIAAIVVVGMILFVGTYVFPQYLNFGKVLSVKGKT